MWDIDSRRTPYTGHWFAHDVCPHTNPKLPFAVFFKQCSDEIHQREKTICLSCKASTNNEESVSSYICERPTK